MYVRWYSGLQQGSIYILRHGRNIIINGFEFTVVKVTKIWQ